MLKSFLKKLLIFSALFFASFGVAILSAQAVAGCPDSFAGLSKPELETALVSCEREIVAQESILKDKQVQGVSLERDIAILNAQIEKAKLLIKAQNISIARLADDIGIKNRTIGTYASKIDREKESLSGLLRRTNELDTYSIAEVALSNSNFSEFFVDIDNFQYIEEAIGLSLDELDTAKKNTEEAKAVLEEKKNTETDLRYQKELEKKDLANKEAEKAKVLKVTKGQEKEYLKVLKEKQSVAAKIRAQLFALRDTGGIPFGKALEYANFAAQKTGVRAAFILAILTQESNLGQNEGSCILSSPETGDGVGKNTGTVFEQIMKAPRDTVPFLDITKRLGLDWKKTPVSCPPGSKYYSGRGFGGGMGPSQFIPSTWELFKDRIGKLAGVSADLANPWDPKHVFIATGIYMSDLGASTGSYTAERNAACKYYSGASCKPGRRPANVFYGDSVMKLAESIQTTKIDLLGN